MSLTGALNIGRSALSASQLAIQVAGNNLANAATPGYSRQIARLTPLRGDGATASGQVGSGVGVSAIQRQIDQALLGRVWQGTSDQSAADTRSNMLAQVESALNELNDSDLSSQLSSFFNAWSELANGTKSGAAVIQKGAQLADFMRSLRASLMDQKRQTDAQAGAAVNRANELMSKVADLNRAINDAEVSGNTANTLRDQRDQVLTDLSQMMDISIVDRGQQGVDVLVGSSPVVLGARSRGIELKRETVNGQTSLKVATVSSGTELAVRSGQLGALLDGRTTVIDDTVSKLDSLASSLIFEVNKLHSTGAGSRALTDATGDLKFAAADRAAALNDPANGTLAGLPFKPVNGGFLVTVTQKSTGAQTQVRINVDLDGITNAGTPGTADDTSAEQIRASLNSVAGLSATFTPDGRLRVKADEGFEYGFSDDSSGALAVVGLNTYFAGTNAASIGVRDELTTDPSRLAAGRTDATGTASNGTALRVAALQSAGVTTLNGSTIPGHWQDAVQGVGAAAAAARTAASATGLVRDSLDAQRSAVSGVSIDEESMNLLTFQRQYQGAARLISVTDEMTQTLLQIV